MPFFVFVQGYLGAGKTTLASIMTHYYKNIVELQLGGQVQLFSNFDLKDSYTLENYTDWYKVADAHGSICVWDEAQQIFDSRTALKGGQIVATQLFNYVRKMQSVQIFASPSIDNVDTRIRGLTEVLLNVRKVGNKGIAVDYYDYQSKHMGKWGRYMHTRFIPMSKLKKIYALQLFDSFSMVGGFPLPKTERQIKEFFATLDERHNEARKKLRLRQGAQLA